ncbi:hypothetical protein ACFX10_024274 [Malus domestica]
MPVFLCSADYLLQEVAQCLIKCFCKTVGRSMIHEGFVLLELVFLAELIHESVRELFSVVSDNVARHTISVDDMFLDKTDDSFLLDFLQGYGFSPLGEVICCSQDVSFSCR